MIAAAEVTCKIILMTRAKNKKTPSTIIFSLSVAQRHQAYLQEIFLSLNS